MGSEYISSFKVGTNGFQINYDPISGRAIRHLTADKS